MIFKKSLFHPIYWTNYPHKHTPISNLRTPLFPRPPPFSQKRSKTHVKLFPIQKKRRKIPPYTSHHSTYWKKNSYSCTNHLYYNKILITGFHRSVISENCTHHYKKVYKPCVIYTRFSCVFVVLFCFGNEQSLYWFDICNWNPAVKRVRIVFPLD